MEEVITSKNFDVPTTAALFGDTLALVNAKFTTPAANELRGSPRQGLLRRLNGPAMHP